MFHSFSLSAHPAAARGPRRRRRVQGFSLVEQAAVVAALGLLSATALPRLADLRSDAQTAALAALAGAAGTAMLLNQGVCAVRGGAATDGACVSVRDCRHADAVLATPLPAGYELLPQPLQPMPGRAVAAEADCALVHSASGARASFKGVSAGGG